jgi:hypothetical protein
MSWEVVSCWIEGHPGLASWVQAVGSIVSIWGAFAISNRQQIIQIKLAEKAAKEKSESFYGVIENAYKVSEEFGKALQSTGAVYDFGTQWNLIHRQQMESSVYSLSRLPAHELGGYQSVRAFNGIMGAVTDIVRSVNAYTKTEAFRPQELIFLQNEAIKQVEIVEACWTDFQKAEAQRNR